MLNHEQFVTPEDRCKLCTLLEEAENILKKYPYNRNNYISNMDRLKIAVSQSVSYINMLLVDYSDTNEDK